MPRIDSDDDDEQTVPLNDRSNRQPTSDSENEGPDASYQANSPRRKRARVSHDERGVRQEGRRASEANPRSERSGRRSERRDDEEEAVGEEEDPEAETGAVEDDEEVDDEEIKPKIVTQPRDVDGYVPGSIVRIKMKDFLTYDDAEFRPGPYLNMVLGPNGTGKSSIACAICLGLAFKPSILGRATEITQFVRIGAKEGFVEIELKGPAGKRNLIVTRMFGATQSGSFYMINGKSVTQKSVTDTVRALNVQVDNLCTFLPQDRVSHFAQLTPVELLKATQNAAGDPQLTKWHEDLMKRSKEEKELTKTYDETAKKLEYERQQNDRIKVEVDKFKERKAIQDNLAFWENCVSWVEYNEAFATHTALKRDLAVAKSKLQELMARNKPLNELTAQWKEKAKYAQGNSDKYAKESERLKAAIKDSMPQYDLEASERKTEDIQKRLDQLDTEEKNRKIEIEKLTEKIRTLESELANPPKPPEPKEAIQQESDRVGREELAIRNEKGEIDENMKLLNRELERANGLLNQSQNQMRQLSQIQTNRLKKFSTWDYASALVANWLINNQHLFEQEIFLPPCISVSVPDPKYQSAVEACFNQTQIKMFVAQTQADYAKFNSLVNGHQHELFKDPKIRINLWYRPKPPVAPLPIAPKDLPNFGFDCYAMDKAEFPPGLRGFLEGEVALHRTPIALQDHRVNADRVMEQISSTGPGRGFFLVQQTKYMVSKSSYGQRHAFMNTTGFPLAKNFNVTTATPAEVNEAEERIREAQARIDSINQRRKDGSEAYAGIEEKTKEIQAQRAAVKKRLELFTANSQYTDKRKIALVKLRSDQTKLLNAPSVAVARTKSKNDLLATLQKRKKLLQDHNNLLATWMQTQQKLDLSGLESIQAQANYQKLDSLTNKQDIRTKRAQEAAEKCKSDVDEAKQKVRGLLKKTEEAFASSSPEMQAQFDAVPMDEKQSWTMAFVQDKIDEYKAELEANFAVNPHVVEQYERRLRTIMELERKESDNKAKLGGVQRKIESARSQWYPALKSLVSGIGTKFSAAFDRMGCAGEIHVTETDDYATWSLDILVKFRSSEKLQQLTAQRQSGGERSLTTILYLMSLTEYARAPFSLVDEINQGMDARAERAVHDQLVETTCRGDAGQYFLITPKLLPDLTYHKRMRILCINNGDWLPEQRVGSLKDLVNGYVAKRNATANGGP